MCPRRVGLEVNLECLLFLSHPGEAWYRWTILMGSCATGSLSSRRAPKGDNWVISSLYVNSNKEQSCPMLGLCHSLSALLWVPSKTWCLPGVEEYVELINKIKSQCGKNGGDNLPALDSIKRKMLFSLLCSDPCTWQYGWGGVFWYLSPSEVPFPAVCGKQVASWWHDVELSSAPIACISTTAPLY